MVLVGDLHDLLKHTLNRSRKCRALLRLRNQVFIGRHLAVDCFLALDR